MFLLLRIIAVMLTAYFLYVVVEWWRETYSPTVTCPQCDGEGTWESTREIETCLLCKGSGEIDRQE